MNFGARSRSRRTGVDGGCAIGDQAGVSDTLPFDARRALVVADGIALTFAAAVAMRTGPRASRPAIALATLLTPISLAACALYTRSFARAPQDEWYAMAVPGLIALAGFSSLCAIPGAALDRRAGLTALGRGFAGCALLRAVLHGRIAKLKGRVGNGPAAAPRRPRREAVKRTMDVVLTVAVAPIAAFVGLAVALAIVLDDGGPVFFVQERVGRNNRPFRLFKFRTMRAAAGDAWAVADDPRITRIGRFVRATSLDEVPQLMNVLRGEMSLVGPRPEMVAYAQTFARRHGRYAERMRVKPGITGWAQVTLPRVLTDDDMGDVLAADLFYVANGSLVFDAAIIVKTAIEVLFHRVA